MCRIIVAVGVYRIGQVVWALMCVDCEHHQCQPELQGSKQTERTKFKDFSRTFKDLKLQCSFQVAKVSIKRHIILALHQYVVMT